MTEELVARLKKRNDQIIRAVIRKAERDCPGSVALIGITGSFQSGDTHPKSDLDLCIVINDDAGWKVGCCFILGDVAHDIYCTPWSRLEEMSRFTDPWVSRLLALDIVYCPEARHRARYEELGATLRATLGSPLTLDDLARAEKHMAEALRAYAGVVLSDDLGECRYASAAMLVSIECALYMVNKTWVAHGIKRIPEELGRMNHLPPGFLHAHDRVVRADTVVEIRTSSTALIKGVDLLLRDLRKDLRAPITAAALVGTYEEITSNWRNKMHNAAENGDAYLSLMTASSCQGFYNQVYGTFDIPRIDAFGGFDPRDLQQSAGGFDSAMERYRELYTMVGQPVRQYVTMEEFEGAYLA